VVSEATGSVVYLDPDSPEAKRAVAEGRAAPRNHGLQNVIR
jgi:hypothetical protein